jgi:CRP-like cAMP-binding protein/tRNA A-37 threonylcarbamoyl transferase component Bud32
MKPAESWKLAPGTPARTGDSVLGAPEELPTVVALGEPPSPTADPTALPIEVGQGFSDEGEIGVGGSGSIRRVLDRKLQRRVAMKVLAPRLAGKRRHVERFVLEAQIVAQLDHPNVPPIHDLGFDRQGRPYFTMKLVDGHTLHERVRAEQDRRDDPAVLATLLGVFLKVCEAVAFAHSRGVCHCDIKPENIMVGAFGEAYLMDWGIASARDEMARSELLPTEVPAVSRRPPGIRGTPAYMAPEQAAGDFDQIGERTDIFGLGTVLYFIGTGVAPFEGRDTIESLRRAKAASVAAPERLAALTPIALQRVIARAMAVRPEDRYASVMELHDDVEGILRGAWYLPTQRFPPGTRIVTEGEPGDAAFVIVSGTCRVTKRAGPRTKVLRRLGPGEVFGETAVLSHKRRTASVEAVDEVVVRVVTREVLERELGVRTDLGKFVLVLADRFCQMDTKLSRLEALVRKLRRKSRARAPARGG